MIDKTVTALNLLIAAFVAGAVVCAVGLGAAIVGIHVQSTALFPVFAAVGLFVASNRLSEQVGAEHERERVRLEGDRLRNERVTVELEQLRQPAPIRVIREVTYRHDGTETALGLDDTRSARWLGWQVAAERLAGWYVARHSLTANVLVPGAFADRDAWVAATDELARVGLLTKRNGTATRWAVPFAEARETIESASVEWTDAADAPTVALAPSPAGTVVGNGAALSLES